MRKPKTPLEKIRSCKALQGKSVLDVCMLSGFLDNLSAYVKVQREERNIALQHAQQFGGGKMHAPAHPIDKTLNWSDEQWREEFMMVFDKTSTQPAGLREYIYQLGMQAYNITIANLVILEYPEMRSYFFKKSKVV